MEQRQLTEILDFDNPEHIDNLSDFLLMSVKSIFLPFVVLADTVIDASRIFKRQ